MRSTLLILWVCVVNSETVSSMVFATPKLWYQYVLLTNL